jgi:hypothetical protein
MLLKKNIKETKMKKDQRLFSAIFVVCCSLVLVAGANAQANADENKNITLSTKAVEIISVTKTADKCRDKKGITLRLRVVSDSPVDVLSYKKSGQLWGASQFNNQKKGDEIVDFACYEKAAFKVYSRPTGSSEDFPKP